MPPNKKKSVYISRQVGCVSNGCDILATLKIPCSDNNKLSGKRFICEFCAPTIFVKLANRANVSKDESNITIDGVSDERCLEIPVAYNVIKTNTNQASDDVTTAKQENQQYQRIYAERSSAYHIRMRDH
ncbi:hypothetical protein GJ496_006646 [Pomphorhynchus laevis]|nr:hypothetical protein GJ496_006646 [Pomphorhynchus laevis]